MYGSVKGVTRLAGGSIDALLARVAPRPGPQASSPQREALLAALNGVLGDQLLDTANPLAIRMSLRHDGQSLPMDQAALAQHLSHATGKILLLVHGLCMNDLQWTQAQGASGTTHDHGQALAASLGYTPVYLRYNSGRHTSENGAELAAQLEHLLQHWPLPVTELSILAHSMGGLVTRNAVHAATLQGLRWPGQLKNIVFLGTPHHGAPMERAGNWIDVVLGSTRYSAPFAKIGQLRSAGITDLRYGHVLEADWLGQQRFRRSPDRRHPLPLPPGVHCFTVAATTAARRGSLAERLLGDGLVPIPSALGQHPQAKHRLVFAKQAQRIVYRVDHWGLLKDPQVTRQLQDWLG